MTQAGAQSVQQGDLFVRYDQQTFEGGGPFRLAGAVLRAPGPLVREIGAGRDVLRHAISLLAVAVVLSAMAGAATSMFAGAFWSIVKIPIVVVGSSLLCTPTLYVFNALRGSPLTYLQTVALVLLTAAALSLILVAFAPIVWFFGVSTGAVPFMTVLHVVIFACGVAVGLRTLAVAGRYLAHLAGSPMLGGCVLVMWSFLVIVVGLQMAYTFRPILVSGPLLSGERGLFMEALAR